MLMAALRIHACSGQVLLRAWIVTVFHRPMCGRLGPVWYERVVEPLRGGARWGVLGSLGVFP